MLLEKTPGVWRFCSLELVSPWSKGLPRWVIPLGVPGSSYSLCIWWGWTRGAGFKGSRDSDGRELRASIIPPVSPWHLAQSVLGTQSVLNKYIHSVSSPFIVKYFRDPEIQQLILWSPVHTPLSLRTTHSYASQGNAHSLLPPPPRKPLMGLCIILIISLYLYCICKYL